MVYKYNVDIRVTIHSDKPLNNDKVYFEEPIPATDEFRVSLYETGDIEELEV